MLYLSCSPSTLEPGVTGLAGSPSWQCAWRASWWPGRATSWPQSTWRRWTGGAGSLCTWFLRTCPEESWPLLWWPTVSLQIILHPGIQVSHTNRIQLSLLAIKPGAPLTPLMASRGSINLHTLSCIPSICCFLFQGEDDQIRSYGIHVWLGLICCHSPWSLALQLWLCASFCYFNVPLSYLLQHWLSQTLEFQRENCQKWLGI